jgi:hypothetical protein
VAGLVFGAETGLEVSFFAGFFSFFLLKSGVTFLCSAGAGAGALAGSAAKDVKANADKIVAINVFISFP